MSSKIKIPPPNKGKIIKPHDVEGKSTDHCYPGFSFYFIQKDFKIVNCDSKQKNLFLSTIEIMSEQVWLTLITSRKEAGFEKIDKNDLLVPLPNFITDDITILSKRMSQRGRIVGFRSSFIFHIIWIDPLHKTYKG